MTLKLYPASAHDAYHGTGIQFSSTIDEAAQKIHDACKGSRTDEQTLIAVLGSKSPESRHLISLRFKELYQQPLKIFLKSRTSGEFGRLLCMISTPLPETEAQILHDATKGMSSTENLIMQILAGRTSEEMSILKRTYFDLVGKDLAVTINSKLVGDFRTVVMAVLQSSQVPYNSAVHNAAKAEEEAAALYKAGQGRLGTNEEVFIDIIVKASPEFLKMVDAVYVAKYNNNIAKAVDKEFSGDAKKSLNFYVRLTLDPYSTIAELFETTMKDFGTDETRLSTTLVRYQSVLPHVKAVYKRAYCEELRDKIGGKTSGNYKKILLEVYDAPHDPPRIEAMGAPNSGPPSCVKKSEYLPSKTSCAPASSAHKQCSARSAYPTPTEQQCYSKLSQASSFQAPFDVTLHQAASPQPKRYLAQSSNFHQASEISYCGQSAAQPKSSAPSFSSLQQPYAPSGKQLPVPQYQQHYLPEQQPSTQPNQEYSAGYQKHPQQPLNQNCQQYPPPGGQRQPFQLNGVASGPELQPLSQSYQQYPVSGLQPPCQPYQQYPVNGQQHLPSQPYQQYPASQQPHYPPSQYQQYPMVGGQAQQDLSQSYSQRTPHGEQTSTQSYQQYKGYGQQQYPIPHHFNVSSGQMQPCQQYSGQSGQPDYPSSYGTVPPPQQLDYYSHPHQPLHGFFPNQGM